MGYAYTFISGVLGQWRSWYNCSTYPRRFCSGNTHTSILRPFFWDHLREPVPEEIFRTFMVQGKITDNRPCGWAPLHSGVSATHLHRLPIFMPDSLPAHFILAWTGTKCAGLHTQWRGCVGNTWRKKI